MRKRQIKKAITKLREGRKLTVNERRYAINAYFAMMIKEHFYYVSMTILSGYHPKRKGWTSPEIGGIVPLEHTGEIVNPCAETPDLENFTKSVIANLSIAVSIPVEVLTGKYKDNA